MRPPRLISPRPTKAGGNSSRSPKIGSSTSTYFPEAMLPSSTTSQSGPMLVKSGARTLLERATVARIREIDRLSGKRLNRLARHGDVSCTQAGIRRNDQHSARDESIGRIGRPAESPRVRQLPSEVEAADEANTSPSGAPAGVRSCSASGKLRGVGHDTPRPHTSAIGRRQQKDAMLHSQDLSKQIELPHVFDDERAVDRTETLVGSPCRCRRRTSRCRRSRARETSGWWTSDWSCRCTG